jgi:hypothetical protein
VEVDQLGFGSTHWNVRADVAAIASRVRRRYGVTWNTYHDHPPGFALDNVSVDFWGPNGRGDELRTAKIQRMGRRILRMRERPAIRWIIAERRIWTPADGWRAYSYRPTWDRGHLHVTFW